MNSVLRLNALLARLLTPLAAPLALVARWYVGWQFFKSGLLKVGSWDTTLMLFESEYHVPVLPPHLAAYAGAFGELFFPVVLFLGLFGRIGALGLFAVNAMAVLSYSHVLFQEGMEAAIGQHILWGSLLVYLAVHGPGAISADRWLSRRATTTAAY
ncbi:MAG TPA: DoxX family protein [Burkholderiaceae bacterium]|nr:DoxX family protein [Burkholderiaceae bacterium]